MLDRYLGPYGSRRSCAGTCDNIAVVQWLLWLFAEGRDELPEQGTPARIRP
jgi:hypothetical protein